jgi:hypothetical protein
MHDTAATVLLARTLRLLQSFCAPGKHTSQQEKSWSSGFSRLCLLNASAEVSVAVLNCSQMDVYESYTVRGCDWLRVSRCAA